MKKYLFLLALLLLSLPLVHCQNETNVTYLNSTFVEVNTNDLSYLLKTFTSTFKEVNSHSLAYLLKTFSSQFLEEEYGPLIKKEYFHVIYPKPGEIAIGDQKVIYNLSLPYANPDLYQYKVSVYLNGELICEKVYAPGYKGTDYCNFTILEINKTYTLQVFFKEYEQGNLAYSNNTTILLVGEHYPFNVSISSPPNGTILSSNVLNVTVNVSTPQTYGITYMLRLKVFQVGSSGGPVIFTSKEIPPGIAYGTVYAKITFNRAGDFWILATIDALYNNTTLVDTVNSTPIYITVPKDVIPISVPPSTKPISGGGVVFQPQPVYVPINQTNITTPQTPPVEEKPATKSVLEIVQKVPLPVKALLIILTLLLIIHMAVKRNKQSS